MFSRDKDKPKSEVKPVVDKEVIKTTEKLLNDTLPQPMYPGKLCPKHHVSPMGHGWHK